MSATPPDSPQAAPEIAALLPPGAEAAVLRGPGRESDLLEGEHEAIRRAAPARRREFAAGRACARHALAALGVGAVAVPQAKDRAPLWPDVREEFRARFSLDISDYYGIAETGPVTFELDEDYTSGLGKPLPGVELRIAADEGADDGEVLVRTESMASGYLNHPGLFEERVDADGFYHSGDRGRITPRS